MTNNPYATPTANVGPPGQTMPVGKPDVVTWFQVYTGVLAGITTLLGIVVLGLAVAAATNAFGDDNPPPAWFFVIYGLVVIGMSAVYWIPLYYGARPWVWTYSLVIICLGLGSCTIIFALPLLIYWLKPETKAYYGKS